MQLKNELGGWYDSLNFLFDTPVMLDLGKRLSTVQDLQPRADLIFRAYREVYPENLKVLLLGQDPYPGGQANGLAFSSTTVTPSLRVILAELQRTGFNRTSSELDSWSKQGVMLLNTVLTTEKGRSDAHRGWGWELFIQHTLQVINNLPQPYVVMAWGKPAKDKINTYIKPASNRLILESVHPQAENFSGGRLKFTGCNHFVLANEFLQYWNIEPVNWAL